MAGGTAQKLPLDLKHIRHLCFQPDGKRVAFTKGLERYEVWALENIQFQPEPAK